MPRRPHTVAPPAPRTTVCHTPAVRALLIASSLLGAPQARAEEAPSWAAVRATTELGMLAPLSHHIQYGRDGSDFDYVDEGGQNSLFFFARLSAEVQLAARHIIVLLYQPLELKGEVRLRRDLVLDELTFSRGTPIDLRYGFDFYRASYLYDFFDDPDRELSLGVSLQLRNATVSFTSADGKLRRDFRDIGPVPLIKARWRQALDCGLWLGAEADLIYAPVKYINGGDSDVEGALFDVSLRAGIPAFKGGQVFVNLRYLGGGASGTSPDAETVGDGYVSNWLHFLSLSVGGELTLSDLF